MVCNKVYGQHLHFWDTFCEKNCKEMKNDLDPSV